MKACHYVPDDLIGFNEVKSYKGDRSKVGVHFYIDDYQFERIWTYPYKYLGYLQEHACVITPDFSTYEDMPMAMKIWNLYRAYLIGQVMQDAGINVIPNLRDFGADTVDMCLESIEPGGVVAISTISSTSNPEFQEEWYEGTLASFKKLKPECVICYGLSESNFDFGDFPVKYIRCNRFNG